MHATLDDLVTALYVFIDDLLPKRARMGRPPRITDAELVCLAVAQVLLDAPSERAWLRRVRPRFGHLFPYVPQQAGYNKRLRGLAPTCCAARTGGRRRVDLPPPTAGGTRKMLDGLAARNLIFSVGMRTSDEAVAGIQAIDETTWQDAVDTDGQPREGAQVTEVAHLVPSWAPQGTRAIVRRERPHPGATLRLWDYNGWRHQVVLTNDDTVDIAALEARHRGHAQVENRIKNLKDTGLSRLPFRVWNANRLWVELVLLAAVLLAALQQLVDDDELRVAEPRRLRYTLLNVAAKIAVHARRTWLHLDAAWPWTPQLLTAHERLPRLTPTPA